MAGPGWQRDDLFEIRDPEPGQDYSQEESLLLFGDVLGTGAIASERSGPLQSLYKRGRWFWPTKIFHRKRKRLA